jgi:hypothetical protein
MKRFHRIVLKKIKFYRKIMKKIIYEYDEYYANDLDDASIKRLIRTEKRMNKYGVETEEPLDHEPYSMIPYFLNLLQFRQLQEKTPAKYKKFIYLPD